MQRRILSAILPVLFIFAAAGGLAAQGVTTSAVTGTVTGDGGAPAPGMQVTITQENTGATTGVLTRADGRYTISGLQPGGPYTLTVQGIGYETQSRSGIDLVLSQTARFDFALSTQAVEVVGVEVTAERGAIISRDRTGTATTVSDSVISRMPTITRDFTDFTRLTPQISTAGGASNAAGRNGRFNNIQIDGAVNNDVFGLAASGTPGGQAGTKPITLEAIQEFQVVLAPFDVRQGGFTGAGVNAVTRSGTNDFKGTISYFGRTEDLVGNYKRPDGSTSSDFGDFSEGNFAGSLGGPIKTDRVHFFVAGERSRRSAPNSGVAIGRDANITAAEAQAVVDALAAYGIEGGGFTETSIDRGSDNIFGRLDFNLGNDHRLTLRHNYVKGTDDNLSRSNSFYMLESAQYIFNSTTNSTVAQLNSNFGGRFFNELRVGYQTIRDKRAVPNKTPFVTVQLPNGRTIASGAENFSAANALDQDVIELTNDLSFSRGAHNLTVGTHNEFFKFSNLFVRNPFGNYQFGSVEDLRAANPNRFEASYLLPGGNVRAEFPAHQLAFYVQDSWDATDRLNLIFGLRYDLPLLPDEPGQNPTVSGAPINRNTSDVPNGNGLFNPRFGFNWNVNGDQSLQVRGGTGLFSGRTPYVWISNAYGNTGLDYVRFTCSGTSQAPAFVADPDQQPRNCEGSTALALNEINTLDPDFKFPQVFRTSLAVDKALPMGFVGTLEGLYSKSVNDVLYRELTINFDAPTTTVEGRPRFAKYPTSVVPFSNITDVTNTSENYSYSLTGQLQKRFSENYDISVAYTFTKARDVTSTTSSQAFSNWRFNPINANPNDPALTPSNFEVPHRLLAFGSYRFELFDNSPTDISLIYVGESGRPYSFTYNSTDINADGSNGNDLLYVPATQSEIRFAPGTGSLAGVTPEQSWQNFNSYIDSIECLDEARGRVMDRNECREPWSNRFDVRVAQTVGVRDHRVELTLDLLNASNLLNKEWGLSKFVSNQNDVPLRATSGTPTPDANGRVLFQAFGDREEFLVSDESSRYRIQLGARYAF